MQDLYARDGITDAPPPLTLRWSAIIAGVVTAIAVQGVLTALGVALGISIWAAVGRSDSAAVGYGALAWWFIAGLVSLGAGGMVAGYLCPTSSGCLRAIHGFLTWAVVTVLGFSALALGGAAAGTGAAAYAYPVQMGITSDYRRAAYEQADVGPTLERAPGTPVTGPLERSRPTPEERATAAGIAWVSVIALLLGAAAATLGAWFIRRGPKLVVTGAPSARVHAPPPWTDSDASSGMRAQPGT